MFSFARSLMDRFKSLFVTHAVLELEADLIAAYAERKAELLRRADQYEKEGMHAVAEQLRQQVDRLSPDKPLGSALTITAHLQVVDSPQSSPLVDTTSNAPLNSTTTQTDRADPAPKKKNGKS